MYLSTSPSAPPAFSADGLDNFSVLSAIQETLKIGKTISGEAGRCAGKREKAGEALRYALISAQELRKIGGKAREGVSHRGREGGNPAQFSK